jgi:hypothetical protein
MSLKEFFYSATSRIIFDDSNGEITIHVPEEILVLNESGKPKFDNATGESVTEFSGLASDQRSDRSWAIARYQEKGYSALHYHNEQTENYYVIAGQAKVIVDDQEYFLSPGETITIFPGQKHQVFSVGEKNLTMVVRCTPAWRFSDQHFVVVTSTLLKLV